MSRRQVPPPNNHYWFKILCLSKMFSHSLHNRMEIQKLFCSLFAVVIFQLVFSSLLFPELGIRPQSEENHIPTLQC